MDDARLDHLQATIENATGQHTGPEAASLDLEALVDEGELTIRDVAWLIERARMAERDIADGPIDWHIKPHTKGVVTFTMRSSVKPTTWLSMFVDRAGWEEIKAAGDAELAKTDGLE
jgi:hypothetical protein